MIPFVLPTIVTPHDAAFTPSASRRMETNISSPFAANVCDDPHLVACIPLWAHRGVSTLREPMRLNVFALMTYAALQFVSMRTYA